MLMRKKAVYAQSRNHKYYYDRTLQAETCSCVNRCHCKKNSKYPGVCNQPYWSRDCHARSVYVQLALVIWSVDATVGTFVLSRLHVTGNNILKFAIFKWWKPIAHLCKYFESDFYIRGSSRWFWTSNVVCYRINKVIYLPYYWQAALTYKTVNCCMHLFSFLDKLRQCLLWSATQVLFRILIKNHSLFWCVVCVKELQSIAIGLLKSFDLRLLVREVARKARSVDSTYFHLSKFFLTAESSAYQRHTCQKWIKIKMLKD